MRTRRSRSPCQPASGTSAREPVDAPPQRGEIAASSSVAAATRQREWRMFSTSAHPQLDVADADRGTHRIATRAMHGHAVAGAGLARLLDARAVHVEAGVAHAGAQLHLAERGR